VYRCTSVYTCAYIYVYMWTCVSVCVFACIYVRTCVVCEYVYEYIGLLYHVRFLCSPSCVCVRAQHVCVHV